MKNTVTKNLIVLGALAVVFVSTHSALAFVPGLWDPQPNYNVTEPGFKKVVATYDAPVVPQMFQTVYSTRPVAVERVVVPPVQTQTTTRNTTVTRANINTNFQNTDRGFVNNGANYQDQFNQNMYPVNNGNDLTALSLAGSGGFMPSSVWQWIMVILLILIIIIIARMLTKKPGHDTHTVAHH